MPFSANFLKLCVQSSLAVSSITFYAGKPQSLLLQAVTHIFLLPPQLSQAGIASVNLIPQLLLLGVAYLHLTQLLVK